MSLSLSAKKVKNRMVGLVGDVQKWERVTANRLHNDPLTNSMRSQPGIEGVFLENDPCPAGGFFLNRGQEIRG
jgi:hypothetical protein